MTTTVAQPGAGTVDTARLADPVCAGPVHGLRCTAAGEALVLHHPGCSHLTRSGGQEPRRVQRLLGCRRCRTQDLAAAASSVFSALDHLERAASRLLARGEAAAATLRRRLDPQWAFRGDSLVLDMLRFLDASVHLGWRAEHPDLWQRWRHDLETWAWNWSADQLQRSPHLDDPGRHRRLHRVVVNWLTAGWDDSDVPLCRRAPVTAHYDSGGETFAIFAVLAEEARHLVEQAHRDWSGLLVRRGHQVEPWAARIDVSAADLGGVDVDTALADPDLWVLVHQMLTASRYSTDVSVGRLVVAATRALAGIDGTWRPAPAAAPVPPVVRGPVIPPF